MQLRVPGYIPKNKLNFTLNTKHLQICVQELQTWQYTSRKQAENIFARCDILGMFGALSIKTEHKMCRTTIKQFYNSRSLQKCCSLVYF